jgi:ubiquinone/menaquinone biosynthesis C-methylase UbiE
MSRLLTYVDAMVHKNPGAKFLELGAGTGSMTHQLMKTLTTHGDGETCSPRYGQFDYTDLSPSFFDAARAKYRDHGNKMQFKTLNIETDLESQGFKYGTYDAIFAAAVSTTLS